ncbi:MAG: IS3 family transposase [Nitrosomonas sp.]|nr:IS3 family transposase [Nitrosomonas sp.]
MNDFCVSAHILAMSESFFHTLKTELIYHQMFHSREEAIQTVFE